MALSPIELKPKQTGGKGGLFGKIFGTVLGGAAGGIGGFFAGGPAGAAAGAMGGAKLGGSLGGAAGNAIDPAKVEGGRGVPLASVASKDAGVQLAQLMESKDLLQKSTEIPEPKKAEPMSILDQAIEVTKRRIG